MSRSYKGIKLKKNWVYSVEDMMREYSVTASTLSAWVGIGLMPSDSVTPYRFQGAAGNHFHKEKRKLTSSKLAPAEFQCWTCQMPVRPSVESVTIETARNGSNMSLGTCPHCSRKVQKFVSETDRDKILICRNPDTPADCQHEEDSLSRGGIGIIGKIDSPKLWTQNDRIIFKWQIYAGGHSIKTIDRHLAAIRYFEDVLMGKSFIKLTIEDIAKVRDDLKRRAEVGAKDTLSSSSIRHIVSHLVAFLDWLLKQDGFKRLPQDLTGYLKLPRAILAAAMPVKQMDCPTLIEAEGLLNQMPSTSLMDQRARAIFAVGFLGALRADTMASLKVKHIDIANRLILQDAKVVRAKAGKNINIFWFPIQKSFEMTVINWVEQLRRFGFSDEDALFPNEKRLKHRPFGKASKPVPVMTTQYAITQAFAIACQNSAHNYTPHCVKHTIGAERDARPLTQLERKAWSENMGHENEQITERHYGKLTDEMRFGVLENIGTNSGTHEICLSESAKAALYDKFIEQVSRK